MRVLRLNWCDSGVLRLICLIGCSLLRKLCQFFNPFFSINFDKYHNNCKLWYQNFDIKTAWGGWKIEPSFYTGSAPTHDISVSLAVTAEVTILNQFGSWEHWCSGTLIVGVNSSTHWHYWLHRCKHMQHLNSIWLQVGKSLALSDYDWECSSCREKQWGL